MLITRAAVCKLLNVAPEEAGESGDDELLEGERMETYATALREGLEAENVLVDGVEERGGRMELRVALLPGSLGFGEVGQFREKVEKALQRAVLEVFGEDSSDEQ